MSRNPSKAADAPLLYKGEGAQPARFLPLTLAATKGRCQPVVSVLRLRSCMARDQVQVQEEGLHQVLQEVAGRGWQEAVGEGLCIHEEVLPRHPRPGSHTGGSAVPRFGTWRGLISTLVFKLKCYLKAYLNIGQYVQQPEMVVWGPSALRLTVVLSFKESL